MRHVLLDTNIVMDVLFDRAPFAEPAKILFARVRSGELRASLAATSLTTVFYLARKAVGNDEARRIIGNLLDNFEIAPVDEAVLWAAHSRPQPDFEDAVQDAAAENEGIEIIVTRDPKGFVGSTRRVMDAATLIGELDGTP